MTTLTRPQDRPTYAQVLEIARRLSPAEQRRLRDELAKSSDVQLAEATTGALDETQGAPVEPRPRQEVLASLERSLQENADVWDELSKL